MTVKNIISDSFFQTICTPIYIKSVRIIQLLMQTKQ